MSIGGTPIPDPDPTGEYPDGWSGGHPDHAVDTRTYVPSLAQMRRSHDGQWDVRSPHGKDAADEFDRWLADHDRAVAEKTRASTLQEIRLLGDRAIGELLITELGEPESVSTGKEANHG